MPILKRDICDVLDYVALGFVWALAVLFVALTYDLWSVGEHPAGVPIEIWGSVPVLCSILTVQGVRKRHKQPVSTA